MQTITRPRPALSQDQVIRAEILNSILKSLEDRHLAALFGYYCKGLTLEQAAESVGMGVEAFMELKGAVRARFAVGVLGRPALARAAGAGSHAT